MGAEPAREMMAFSSSLAYDQRLLPDDVVASIEDGLKAISTLPLRTVLDSSKGLATPETWRMA